MAEPEPTNNLADKIARGLSGEYEVHGQPADADCLIACTFGYREADGAREPGLSNNQLGAFIANNYASLPIIAQQEITDVLSTKNIKAACSITKPRQEMPRLTTLEVISQAAAFMRQQDWRTALLVAHQNHLTWVDFLAQLEGIQTITPPGLRIDFDAESVEPWTRNIAAWREEVRQRHQLGDLHSPATQQ